MQDDSYDSAFARSFCIVSVLTTCRVSVLLRSLVRGDIPLDELALRRTRDYVHTRSATTVATRTSVGSDISWLLRRRVHHARNARFLQYVLPPSLPPFHSHPSYTITAYSFLDPHTQGAKLAGYIIGIGIGAVIVFAITRSLCVLRERIARRCGRGLVERDGAGEPLPQETLHDWDMVEV